MVAAASAALDKVGRWLTAKASPQLFRLFGYAGTGKTTLARHVAEAVEGEPVFAAFTGKAALVMRSKGCEARDHPQPDLSRQRRRPRRADLRPQRRQPGRARAKLIVIDECSMVDEELGRDLLSFGKPILVLGDPAQLPPVKGGGFFTEAEPDVMLTEIHRQAATIRSSACLRSFAPAAKSATAPMAKAASSAATRSTPPPFSPPTRSWSASTARAVCTINAIRQLLGMSEALPVVGDKLVCLRNERVKGLINGGLWRVEALGGMRKDFVRMSVRAEDDAGRTQAKVAVLKQFFEGAEADLPYAVRREFGRIRLRLRPHRAQGAGLAMG